jgi:hypothetical protein
MCQYWLTNQLRIHIEKCLSYVVQFSKCIQEGSTQTSLCMVLPSPTSRLKMHLIMSICSKTKNKCDLSGIDLNVILKRNLTEPRI